MGTFVATKGNGALAKYGDVFATDNNDLSAGASGGGYAVMSIKSSKWRIKYGGEEQLVTDAEGDPKASVELIMLAASRHVSKTYYSDGYTDGSIDSPTCQSVLGDSPDPGSLAPQAPMCQTCGHNQWGSKITPAGKKAKLCTDSRRIAVVPAGNKDLSEAQRAQVIHNEQYGGAMLLRVPAASLSDLATFGKLMAAKNYPYNTIVVRIGFDPDASYPKLTFKAVRALTETELEAVAGLLSDRTQIDRILIEPAQPRDDDAPVKAAPAPAPKPAPKPVAIDTEFEEDAPAPAPIAVAKTRAVRQPRAQATAAPAPVAPPKQSTTLDEDLNDILGDLDLS
jgi:hypothetical protein